MTDGWGFTWDDELELSDIVAAARLAGMVPGTGRFSRAILAAGYRRTEPPSPHWELRQEFTGTPAAAGPGTVSVEAMRERADAASPGPWLAVTDNGRKNGIGIVGRAALRGTGQAIAVFAGADSAQRNADAEFTAHAREDVPALISEVQRLRRIEAAALAYYRSGGDVDDHNELMDVVRGNAPQGEVR
jgi:hypothetical protein